jgi:hypothetical protein
MPVVGKISRFAGRESRTMAPEIAQDGPNFRLFSKALTLFTER